MKKGNQIYLVNQLVNLSKNDVNAYASDWVALARILIQPTFLQLHMDEPVTFDKETLDDFFAEFISKKRSWLTIGNDENIFTLHRSKGTLLEKNIMTASIYTKYASIIDDYQLQRLQKKGLYGYVRSYDEYLYNNVENLEKRRDFLTEEEISQLPKMQTLEGEIIVDCNQLAGYDLHYEDLCMTSCWKMFYTQFYYRLILKEIWKDVQQVESIIEHPNQLLEIVLFQDPLNWDNGANLRFQQFFRDQMGFNHIAWNNGIGVLKEPYIEYAYRKNLIQTVQYQNNRLQPTGKKDATHFVTRTYDAFHEAYREKRVFGILNTQAYFPWVDEANSSMMNYKILNPHLTLDNGLSAYEYYIRSHLEINVKDQKYKDYITVLQFYIPEEALGKVPVDSIRERLGDVKISRTKKRKGSIRLDMEKGENHLRVIFLGHQHLKQLEHIDEEPKMV